MLNGVGDTSGAILLFGVRPFAEKIPDEGGGQSSLE